VGAIEHMAALLGVINIVLIVRRSIWNYPFGLAMVSLYFFVFWDARLYSDALLQIFFFVIQIYGWWAWAHARQVDHGVAVGWMTRRARLGWGAAIIGFVAIWGTGMMRLTDAVAPYPDASIAGMSIAAQILMSLRRVENWILWIAVDVLAVGLFSWRELYVTAGLYALFLVLATVGYFEWRKKAVA